jgi:SAM-dependent methyltransferase
MRRMKKIHSIMMLGRFIRQIKPLWQRVVTDTAVEERLQKTLDNRHQTINRYINQNSIKKLQIGAGTNYLPGWLNSDYEPTREDIIFLDATVSFPFDSNEFHYVFSEHMIEHIPYKQGMFMMREIYRILKPGGKVRISTPDVDKFIGLFTPHKTIEQKRYIKWSTCHQLGLCSPEFCKLQQRKKEWDIDFHHIERFYPNVEEDGACFIVNNIFRGYGHQFLYDARSLKAIVEEAGFAKIIMYRPNESDDDHLKNIESHWRLTGCEMNDFETMVLQAERP